MEYNFRDIEKKWQLYWEETAAYTVQNESSKPKFYVLDMFPYPSGAGLHVGHPLGYIASDIYSRYKRLKGFNVLHPMGYDSFGLPAEQYAIETGQHPAVTTENNIKTFRSQLNKIGFCYDWSREVRTSNPDYYKWTQWIFLHLFDAWYDKSSNKARKIEELVQIFEKDGSKGANAHSSYDDGFDAKDWNGLDEDRKQEILMEYRLAYSSYGEVNWCEALGTVLANDEVINGLSERGGHPVVKKKMRQWYLRITAYADRLLQGLEQVNFSESLKEQQRNWIGKSQGAEIDFAISGHETSLKVYTTRPDTIFGVDFMVLAPEHELVNQITTPEQKQAIEEYLDYTKSRSERERMAEVKQITGCNTGAFAINPFNGKEIPVWIAEYVLAGYGTGAIMAVPCGDQRDYNFAIHFDIPVTNIIGAYYNGREANPTKDAILENAGFLNGLVMKEAINVAIDKLEELGIGKRQINYRMRDAGYSRQRYWGEPFPVVWENGIAHPVNEKNLPLELPHVYKYGPGPEGEGPLANIHDWVNLPSAAGEAPKYRETSTMPGYAGSSWYFLRYMDPHNDQEFCSRKASDYWGQVDLYIGGTEHAVGHLLYSRMWTKFLYDMDLIGHDEPYKKLVNQGMITGKSAIAKVMWEQAEDDNDAIQTKETGYIIPYKTSVHDNGDTVTEIHLPTDKLPMDSNGNFYVTESDLQAIKQKYPQFADLEIAGSDNVLMNEHIMKENGQTDLLTVEEKMSKSKLNTFTPDDIVDKYGADTFRMYEMFLGPIEQSKPWDIKGIEGVHRFLRKLWRLFFDELKGKIWNEEKATNAELKVLHKTIRKVEDDTERFSFNTAVSTFMVCVNELADLKCNKKEILEPLLILLVPYAPHVTEELYHQLHISIAESTGKISILDADYPRFEEKYVTESSKEYPVSINGKVRTTINISLDAPADEVEKIVLADEIVLKWLDGKPPKKIIYVKGKMINIVV